MTGPGTTATEFATSADGTRIAFERAGTGPVLVHVDGALCSRAFGPAPDIIAAFRDAYTVVTYDRRGRGESGDTLPYAPEREFDDLRAVIEAAGGEAIVLAQSSGAALAYRAAAAGVPMRALVGYEAPWVGIRTGRGGAAQDYVQTLDRLIAEGRNGKAVDYFMVDMVNGPAFLPILFRTMMRKAWKTLQATAPTLRYDARVMGADFRVPTAELDRVAVPTLVLCGSKAAAEMSAAQEQVAAAIPDARHQVLAGQTHQVSPAALRAALDRFLTEVR